MQHCYRMWIDYGGSNLDITCSTMHLFARLWALSHAYKDGMYTDDRFEHKGKKYFLT